jgi:6,7-dimethyl-8-ribityllumazine synthase
MAQDPARVPDASLPPGTRIGLVASSYHAELVDAMARSAALTLRDAGLAEDDLVRVEAPGAFELPLIARRLALRDDLACVLCFGLVLKGETEHDRVIAGAVAHALQRVALDTDTPVLFGVLTCDTLEQARARALPASEGGTLDKGREVARAAIGALAALAAAATAGLGPRRRAGFAPPELRP